MEADDERAICQGIHTHITTAGASIHFQSFIHLRARPLDAVLDEGGEVPQRAHGDVVLFVSRVRVYECVDSTCGCQGHLFV